MEKKDRPFRMGIKYEDIYELHVNTSQSLPTMEGNLNNQVDRMIHFVDKLFPLHSLVLDQLTHQ